MQASSEIPYHDLVHCLLCVAFLLCFHPRSIYMSRWGVPRSSLAAVHWSHFPTSWPIQLLKFDGLWYPPFLPPNGEFGPFRGRLMIGEINISNAPRDGIRDLWTEKNSSRLDPSQIILGHL